MVVYSIISCFGKYSEEDLFIVLLLGNVTRSKNFPHKSVDRK